MNIILKGGAVLAKSFSNTFYECLYSSP